MKDIKMITREEVEKRNGKLKVVNGVVTITNQRTCSCSHCRCDRKIKKGEGYGHLTKSGINYFCVYHTMKNGLLPYYDSEQYISIGTPKNGKIENHTIGYEWETIFDNEPAWRLDSLKRILIDSKFIDSEDSTVDIEYKSPISEGLAQVSKLLQTIEKEGYLHCFDNERCGAHIHTYTSNIAPIRAYYHSLFLPFYEYINSMDIERRIKIFGRSFGEWALRINESTTPTRHSNFINTEHTHTIEWRLPRVTSANQYFTLIKFWREIGWYIDNNFTNCLKPIEGGYRKAQAQKVGADIVEIAKNYFE